MKISAIHAFHLAAPLSEEDTIRSSQMVFDRRSVVVACVETDEGLVGWGESLGQPEVVLPIIENVLSPLLLGKDPIETGVLWSVMARGTWFRYQTAAHIEALSAIDIALWDLKGQSLGKPIYDLLGGAFRTEIPVYATGLYLNTPEKLREEAHRHLSNGFRAMKMKIGYPEGIQRDLDRIETIRDVIGPEVSLMVDANGKFDLPTAIAISGELGDLDIQWLEEPLKPNGPYHDLKGYLQLKARTTVPIAWGEGQYMIAEVRDFLVHRAIDIVQPDACRFGGITETFRLSHLAPEFNIRFAPHFWSTGIGLAATLHISAATNQSFMICEYDQSPNLLREELTTPSFPIKRGKTAVPTGAGLGIKVNIDLLERYCLQKASSKK